MAKYKIRYGVCGICGKGAVPLNHYRAAHGLAIGEIFRASQSKYFCDVHGIESKDPHRMMKHYWDRHASAGNKTIRPQDHITVLAKPTQKYTHKRERLARAWPLQYVHTDERRMNPGIKTACAKCGKRFPTTLLKTRHSKRECAEVISRGEQGADPVHSVYENISNARVVAPTLSHPGEYLADSWKIDFSHPGEWVSRNTSEVVADTSDYPHITAEAIVKAFEERVKGIDELLAGKDKVIAELNAKLASLYREHQAEIDRVKAQREQIDARTDGLVARLFKR